jgi:hypothetical protein
MDYRKLDARLSEALAETDEDARYEVFVEIARDLAPEEITRLEQLGVCRQGDLDSVITAHLAREDLNQVSELPGVRRVRLGRRLRQV